MHDIFAVDPSRIWATLICGFLYVVGMRISLYVYSVIGLSLSQPIQSSIGVIVGTLVSAYVGGIPEGLTVSRIILALALLLGAVILSLTAGRWSAQAHSKLEEKPEGIMTYTVKDLWRSIGLLLLAAAFSPAYTFGLSYGLHSVTQPKGLAVLPFMALLATGAFIGSMATSGVILKVKKQWSMVFHTPLSIAKFGMISGIFHYGGNIIHTFATSFLSSAVSWPLGITGGLWTQLWGLVYGEFKKAPKKAYVALGLGILLYLLGAYTIAFH